MSLPTPETSLTDDELLQQRLDQMAAGLQAALETPDNEWGGQRLGGLPFPMRVLHCLWWR